MGAARGPRDPTANPYLAFSALMMAGLDGIRRELEASLDALEADDAFLCEGGVFTPGLIEA